MTTNINKINFTALLLLAVTVFSGCGQDKSYVEEEVSFTNRLDNITLSGTMTSPVKMDQPAPAVVLVHGSGPCDRNLDIAAGTGLFREFAHYLAGQGIISLRYDKRGVGKSEGNYEAYDLDNFAEDGIAAVNFLEDQPIVKNSCIGAIGISQGGLVTPLMQLQHSAISFLVLMASPGTWDKEFFLQSHFALCDISDTSSAEAHKNRELMNELWPLLSADTLTNDQHERIQQIFSEMWSYMDNVERRSLGYTETNIIFLVDEFTKPNARKWYRYNHPFSLSMLDCPVLAITGNKDRQTPSEYNLTKIEEAFKQAGKSNYTIVTLSNVNHLFQNCTSGLPSEYERIGKDFSLTGFNKIANWIIEQDCKD